MKSRLLSKFLTTILVGTMVAGSLVGCGQQTATKPSEESQVSAETQVNDDSDQTTEVVPEEITYPLDTDIELSIWVKDQLNLNSAFLNAEDSPFHTGLSEKTGVDLEWQFPSAGTDKNTAYNLMLQEEKLPNIILGSVGGVQNGTELLQDGLIYDLTDYLPTYAPDYWEYINRPENAEMLKALKTDDGRLYSVAATVEGDYNITYCGPVIRQDWLDECGLEAPVTMEDWENILVTFKEKYGAVFSFSQRRYNMAGIGNGTGAFTALVNRYYVDENNKVQCAAVQPEWKELLEIFHRWYDMGLLDKDFATMDDATLRSKVLNDEVGVSYTAMSQLSNWIGDARKENTGANWQGFEHPTVTPGEPTKYIQTRRDAYGGEVGALITTSCTEEELILALKFLNYGYTEEGIMYWNYGKEGETYTVDANGNVQWTELITNDSTGISDALSKYTGVSGLGITIQLSNFVQIKNEETSANAVYKWIDNTIAKEYCLPILAYTPDESMEFSDLNGPINTRVSEMALKFITGDESLDKFDDFVKELESLKLDEVIAIQQAAYDRYLNK